MAHSYTPEQLEFITAKWGDGFSASEISERFYRQFHIYVSRNAICGKADRMGLASRPVGGNSSERATAKRLATARANGVDWGRKPKPAPTALPVPSDAPLAVGPLQDFPDAGMCRWPVQDIPNFQCCGHPQKEHSSYCEFHAAASRGYQPKPISGSFRSDRIR